MLKNAIFSFYLIMYIKIFLCIFILYFYLLNLFYISILILSFILNFFLINFIYRKKYLFILI